MYKVYRQTYFRVSLIGLEVFYVLRCLGVGIVCCLFITLFRSAFLYLSSKIIRILHVALISLSDSKHPSKYKLIKNSSGLTVLVVIIIKS